jgi:hypothetical protein
VRLLEALLAGREPDARSVPPIHVASDARNAAQAAGGEPEPDEGAAQGRRKRAR